MIKLYDEALSGLDNKSCKTGSVLLDISKAFDCVDHEILLHKLQHYGIRGKVCKWLESFLTNRTHYVEINGIRSDSYTVVSHIYTYDRAQNILNFVQPLQNLIL